MKYSENFVWQSVGKIIPNLLKVRKADIHLNLPRSLESAAITCWLIAEDAEFKLDFDKQCAAYVVRVALLELQKFGWMTFGEQEVF